MKNFFQNSENYLKGFILKGLSLLFFSNLFAVQEVMPEEFLCSGRFSVVSKYIYTKYYDKQVECEYPIHLYRDVLKVMCPNFQEGNSKDKVGFNEYIKEFNTLITSLKHEGFCPTTSIIPFRKFPSESKSLYFIDGEHRVGACLFYKIPLICEDLGSESPLNRYDSHLFKSGGVNQTYLDHMAIEYARLNNQSQIVVLFSKITESPQKAISLLSEYGDIVHTKEIYVNRLGAQNLVKMFYENENGHLWVFDSRSDDGKTNGILNGKQSGKFTVVLWDCTSIEKSKLCKKLIRDAYPPFSHDTIHISDLHENAIHDAEVLFNKNSIDFINLVTAKQYPAFTSYVKRLREFIDSHPDCMDDYVIDTGAVLSAAGLRDCQDLDIICHPDRIEIFKDVLVKGIDIHNTERLEYNYNLYDLIYNPQNYFFYKGLKFVSIDNIIEYKTLRNSSKDKNDVALLKSL